MAGTDIIIALRTFSGPNLGAEVMLPPGDYVIGTDYSCDVVLSDSGMAARHAVLTVELPRRDQFPRVHVKPLDADVMLEDTAIPPGGQEIPPATAWYLGLTCLSWNSPHAPREEIVPRLPGRAAHPPSPEKPASPAGTSEPGSEKAGTNATVVGTGAATTLPPRRRWPLRLVALLLLTALGALVFEFRPAPDPAREQALQLGRDIREAGLDKVKVASNNGHIAVSGTVRDEKERGLLWTMARNLKYPVYIRVGVREDLAKAVRMKFNASGIFPEVTFPGGEDTLRVAAYIKDPPTEAAAFASLGRDMPDLPRIEKRIVHADQLRGFIERELDRARLRNIAVTMGTGRMDLTDPSPDGNHTALQRVMQRIEENLNIPLAYTIISRDSPPGEIATQSAETPTPGSISPNMPAAAPGISPMGQLRITGVTMGDMRFISTSDGQRIFEGGVLPGGHILESIRLDALTLSKNGLRTTYLLRGDNE